jgi:hypothetical protein
MSEAAEAIVGHAHDKANRRTTGKKVQSQILTKLRKYKKPRNIAATATTVLTEFIPIPGVGTFVGWAEGKIQAKLQDNLHKRRRDSAVDDYHAMKFDLKSFDVKQLDSARHKVKQNVDLYNALPVSSQNKGPCEHAYNIAYRYFRVENRLDKLEALASTMLEIAQEVKDWCDKTRASLDQDNMIKNVLSAMDGSHQKCRGRCVKAADSDSLISAGIASSLFQQFAQSQGALDDDFN